VSEPPAGRRAGRGGIGTALPRAQPIPARNRPAPRPGSHIAASRRRARGAAATAGASGEEIQAALADGSPAWSQLSAERGGIDGIRHARRTALGAQGLDRLDAARTASQA